MGGLGEGITLKEYPPEFVYFLFFLGNWNFFLTKRFVSICNLFNEQVGDSSLHSVDFEGLEVEGAVFR